MNIIQADHLKRSLGPVTAVNDVRLAAGEGEIFGFLGPNGAGKTTTTRILTGAIKCHDYMERACC
jgi:ABC-2 type transport system ATP-binding protein